MSLTKLMRTTALICLTLLMSQWNAHAQAPPPKTRPGGPVTPQSTPPQPIPPRPIPPQVTPSQTPNQVPRVRQQGSRPANAGSHPEQALTIQEAPKVYRRDPNAGQSHWFLGVRTQRAPKGIRVSGTQFGSPASRLGLERGDYILDIGGYVVGEHNGNFYPLETSLQYAGNQNGGLVDILIWNVRTFKQEVHWISLQRR